MVKEGCIMKQSLLSRKTSDFDISYYGRPEKHIVEKITFNTREEAWTYKEKHPEFKGGVAWDSKGNDYITRKIWELPTFENKVKLRHAFNMNNKAYTCCVCCGRDLHENNKQSHIKTKWGIVGPECSVKMASAGLMKELKPYSREKR